ncbi:MAG: hypothetical protein ACLFPL_03255 [Candidatus Nanoarchaeia archaeon]
MLQQTPSNLNPNLSFGTDGMRGRAQDFSQEGLKRLGYQLAQKSQGGVVLIGDDGRESAPWMREAIKGGVEAYGGRAEYMGLTPTPLLSRITQEGDEYQAGVMITASHNPWSDNGVKIFNQDGQKISSELEQTLEQAYHNGSVTIHPKSRRDNINVSQLSSTRTQQEYITLIQQNMKQSGLEGRIAIDCANGATSEIIKEIFNGAHGLEADIICNSPNGININENCGVLHPNTLSNYMQTSDKDYLLGISFDGDGDRMGLHNERGDVILGDYIIGFLAQQYKKQGKLRNNGVVATKYTNRKAVEFLENQEIDVHEVVNGDKAVMEKMREEELSFGGEQSGHIICDPNLGCGDAILAMSEMIQYIDSTIPISQQIGDLFVPNPQILESLRLEEGVDAKHKVAKFKNVIESFNKEFERKCRGRVFVRASGTEPVIRVLTEGENEQLVKEINKEVREVLS